MNFNRMPRPQKNSEEKGEDIQLSQLEELARKMQSKVEAIPEIDKETDTETLEDTEAIKLRETIAQVIEANKE